MTSVSEATSASVAHIKSLRVTNVNIDVFTANITSERYLQISACLYVGFHMLSRLQ